MRSADFLTTMILAGLLAPLAGAQATPGRAAQPDAEIEPRRSTVTDFHRATRLMGKPVRSPANEELGELRDIVLDLPSGRIAYVVLGTGGVLGIGEKLLAIPPSAFSIPLVPARDGHIVLNASPEAIERAPGFARTNWPDLQAALWGAEPPGSLPPPPGARLEQPPIIATPPGYAEGRKTEVRDVHRASRLTGMSVKNLRDETLGEIKEVVVNLPAGTIAYAVLGVGGFLGIGEKLLAIPPLDFSIPEELDRAQHLVLDASPQTIEQASGFPRTNWPDVYSTPAAPGGLSSSALPAARDPTARRPDVGEGASEVRSFTGVVTALDSDRGLVAVEGEREELQFEVHDRTLLSQERLTRAGTEGFRRGDTVIVRYQTAADGRNIAHAIIVQTGR